MCISSPGPGKMENVMVARQFSRLFHLYVSPLGYKSDRQHSSNRSSTFTEPSREKELAVSPKNYLVYPKEGNSKTSTPGYNLQKANDLISSDSSNPEDTVIPVNGVNDTKKSSSTSVVPPTDSQPGNLLVLLERLEKIVEKHDTSGDLKSEIREYISQEKKKKIDVAMPSTEVKTDSNSIGFRKSVAEFLSNLQCKFSRGTIHCKNDAEELTATPAVNAARQEESAIKPTENTEHEAFKEKSHWYLTQRLLLIANMLLCLFYTFVVQPVTAVRDFFAIKFIQFQVWTTKVANITKNKILGIYSKIFTTKFPRNTSFAKKCLFSRFFSKRSALHTRRGNCHQTNHLKLPCEPESLFAGYLPLFETQAVNKIGLSFVGPYMMNKIEIAAAHSQGFGKKGEPIDLNSKVSESPKNKVECSIARNTSSGDESNPRIEQDNQAALYGSDKCGSAAEKTVPAETNRQALYDQAAVQDMAPESSLEYSCLSPANAISDTKKKETTTHQTPKGEDQASCMGSPLSTANSHIVSNGKCSIGDSSPRNKNLIISAVRNDEPCGSSCFLIMGTSKAVGLISKNASPTIMAALTLILRQIADMTANFQRGRAPLLTRCKVRYSEQHSFHSKQKSKHTDSEPSVHESERKNTEGSGVSLDYFINLPRKISKAVIRRLRVIISRANRTQRGGSNFSCGSRTTTAESIELALQGENSNGLANLPASKCDGFTKKCLSMSMREYAQLRS